VPCPYVLPSPPTYSPGCLLFAKANSPCTPGHFLFAEANSPGFDINPHPRPLLPEGEGRRKGVCHLCIEAEILHVLSKVNRSTSLLDLGCGYGRVAVRLSDKAGKVTGIDISEDNIELAKEICSERSNMEFHVMDAADLKFYDDFFDLVICIQNGISAFKSDPEKLISEAVRVTKNGGSVLFSSYSEKIWETRLEWFRIQADLGLIGEIDHTKTKNGNIVCKDGFTATTYTGKDFMDLASKLDLKAKVYEVDESSVFCEINL